MRDYDIKSDLKQEQFQTLKLVQGDRGNKIKINVFEEGQPVNLAGCSVTATYKRSDGEVINNGIIEGTNNLIKYLKIIAFGYRKFDHFIARIFLIKGIIKE